MERRPALRASDSERQLVAERLRHAAVEGRLLAEELEERLTALFASRTYAELDRLVADLPAPTLAPAPPEVRHAKALSMTGAAVAITSLLAILAAFAVATRGHGAAAHLPDGRVIVIGGHPALPLIAALPVLALICAVLAVVAAAGWARRHGGPSGGTRASV
jgi:hypothetical protein